MSQISLKSGHPRRSNNVIYNCKMGWRPRRLHTTSDFVFDDVTLFRRSTSISKPNSSTYLNPRLRYNYFRFGKTTVRRIEILLSVSILTILPYSACHSALGCRTSSKSVHSQLRYDVISIFKMAAAAAQFCIALSRISVSIS